MTTKLKFYAADLESTGLLHDLIAQGKEARIHNFAFMSTSADKHMILHPMEESHRKKLQDILLRDDVVLVMHNGICYDLEALKIFGFDVSKVKIADTLYMSWILDFFKENPRYGLEQYGVELGFPKPPISDWEKLTQEEYDNRVFGDINIQKRLWLKLCNQFAELYDIPKDSMLETNVFNHHAFKYWMWKGEQLRKQQENKWKFDVEAAEKLSVEILETIDTKMEELTKVMPEVPVMGKASPPAKPYKANGELSATGLKWRNLTKKHGFPFDHKEDIEFVKSYNPPNPQSPQQIKNWLESLGWVPETFEYKKDGRDERKIPQVYLKKTGGMVCPSIEALAENHPELEHLVGLGVYKHRSGMVKGWLKNHKEGFLEARAQGFTNTQRLKHAEIVNLPSGRVLLGSEIRSLLTVRNPDNVLIGSDLSSLENRLKFHFQMPLDPDFVNAQMSDDFDPHLAIAVMAGLLTKDEENFYKVVSGGFPASKYKTEVLDTMLSWSEEFQGEEVKRISKIRASGKEANYACVPTTYKVSTPHGVKKWEDLSIGDEVWGSDNYGRRIRTHIQHIHHYKDAQTVGIMMDGEKVHSTRNHRWLKSAGFGSYVTTQDILDDIGSDRRSSITLIPVLRDNIGIYRSHSEGYSLVGDFIEDVFCLTTESGNFEMVLPSGKLMLTGNCQYGAGAKTVARSAKVSLEVGKQLVEGYRELNWSVDVIAKNTFVKRTSFGDFQLNPLNKMFYPLKTDKDRFSTLIQGSGSYVLDLWLMFIEKRLDMAVEAGAVKFRPMLIGQMHDECIYECHKDDATFVRKLIKDAIGDVNQAMKLEVDLDCDVQQGLKYSEIH